jgi:hypothetical protein
MQPAPDNVHQTNQDFWVFFNLIKNFDNEGHKLTVDGSYPNKDNETPNHWRANETFHQNTLAQRLTMKPKNTSPNWPCLPSWSQFEVDIREISIP